MKTLDDIALIMNEVFKEVDVLRNAGQKEYAGGNNGLGNFERLAEQLKIGRKKVLWTYMTKHLDGILSYINGHISQREPVEGRINDAIVYLILLRAMVIDDKENEKLSALTELQRGSSYEQASKLVDAMKFNGEHHLW